MASSRSPQDADHPTHHQDDQPQKKQSKAKSRSSINERRMTNPDLFRQSRTAPVPSSLPLLEASNILTRRKHLPWQTDPDGRLSYVRDFDTDEGAIHFWVTNDAESDHPIGLASAAALAVIDIFDIRAACVHLIYAAYAVQVENPWEHEIVVDDKQLEKYLGLHKRTDLSRQKKLSLIKELVEQLCKLTTFITWKNKPKRKGFTVAEGRLWHLIETRYCYQQDLLNNTKDIVGMTFVIKPGSWIKHFLGGSESGDSDEMPQYSNLSKALLEAVMSIWKHREGAARLMIWLLFKSHQNKLYPYDVKTLLEVAYSSEKVAQAITDNKVRSKIANTWDEDLCVLINQGWGIQFDDKTYSPSIRPLTLGRENIGRPQGFFDQLLTAKVWIGPPKDWFLWSAATQLDLDLQLDGQNLVGVVSMTSDEVKEERKQRGWSQRELASLTGLSQPLISMIEKEERQITVETEAVLRRVFELCK